MVTIGSFDESAVVTRKDGSIQLSGEVLHLQAGDPRFKYNYQNGQVINKKLDDTKYGSPSFLVRIPRRLP